MPETILILGGYGNFGKRIAEDLSTLSGINLVIAGRNLSKAVVQSERLQKTSRAVVSPLLLDINKAGLADAIRSSGADIVIHTGGPFQQQSYHVPEACVEAGAHYIDLADGRRFVCDIASLNDFAQQKNVLVVSGASSVPGLSSVVIDHYRDQFSSIDTIDIAIVPGNKAERGEATVKGILSYTGHSFKGFSKAEWQDIYGWMNPRLADFGDIVGKRWLSNVDVPDLELFPDRYGVKDTVRFQAGLELSVLHLTMVAMAWMAKKGMVKDWSRMSRIIYRTGELFKGFGTDVGGMRVDIGGTGIDGSSHRVEWSLYAPGGVGPYIPTLSAIIIARKLLSGELNVTGATACTGLYHIDDFLSCAKDLGIYIKEKSYG